jgi:hypothetical protein
VGPSGCHWKDVFRLQAMCVCAVSDWEQFHIVTYPVFAWLIRRFLDFVIEFIGPLLYNWLQQFTNHYLTQSSSDWTLHWNYSDFQQNCQFESESHCDWRSVSLSVLVSSPVRGSWPDISYSLTVTILSVGGGRPLWREGGSVFCQSLWTKIQSQVKVMLRPTVVGQSVLE